MKNYYAKCKGKCYAFSDKGSRDTAVNDYGFEKITATQALKEFGYTDSASRHVIKHTVIPCTTPLELRSALTEVVL